MQNLSEQNNDRKYINKVLDVKSTIFLKKRCMTLVGLSRVEDFNEICDTFTNLTLKEMNRVFAIVSCL